MSLAARAATSACKRTSSLLMRCSATIAADSRVMFAALPLHSPMTRCWGLSLLRPVSAEHPAAASR
eukprot:9225855-Prorocentrum_lima.AAC.1